MYQLNKKLLNSPYIEFMKGIMSKSIENINTPTNEAPQDQKGDASILEEYGQKFDMGEELSTNNYESVLEKTTESLSTISPLLGRNFRKYMEERRYFLKGPTGDIAITVTKCSNPSVEFINAVGNKIKSMSSPDGKVDPEIEVATLTESGIISSWSKYLIDSKYKYGPGDYTFECLGLEQTPYQIARLVNIMKTIPSSDFAKFENMRTDAKRIQHIVIDGRSFIHDSAPEAHTLLSKMVEYYDSQQDGKEAVATKRQELADTLQRLRKQYRSGYKEPHEKYMFDLANYDKNSSPYDADGIGIKREVSDPLYDGDKGEVKAIDILRRLVAETEPVPLTPPKTKDESLNQAFERLGNISYNQKTGIMYIHIEDLKDIMSEINRVLKNGQGKREMYPSTISAVAFVDLLSTHALKNLSERDWQEIAFDPTFKEIVRFSQMTSSVQYSENEFESFYNGLLHSVSKAYGDDQVDNNIVAEGYKTISKRIVNNQEAVAKKFSKTKGLESMVDALWSGNLAHELIGLYDRSK